MKSDWFIVLSISFTLGEGGQGRPSYYRKFFYAVLVPENGISKKS